MIFTAYYQFVDVSCNALPNAFGTSGGGGTGDDACIDSEL
jgi:hypothetical protein